MVLVNRNVAPSFNTIIEILQNDQRKIKLIRKYENTRKKIINNECAILFNKTCIDEGLLPKYIYKYIYICIYWHWQKIKCFTQPIGYMFLLHCIKSHALSSSFWPKYMIRVAASLFLYLKAVSAIWRGHLIQPFPTAFSCLAYLFTPWFGLSNFCFNLINFLFVWL